MLELTSVNYLKFPRKPGMDGELGMGGLLLPVLGVCATPSQTGFGDGGDPSRDASMGLQPTHAGGGDMPSTGVCHPSRKHPGLSPRVQAGR